MWGLNHPKLHVQLKYIDESYKSTSSRGNSKSSRVTKSGVSRLSSHFTAKSSHKLIPKWFPGLGLTHLLHSELRWLDVPQRILHKLGVTVHWCLQGKAPQYPVNCCHPTSDVASHQRLRSSSRHHLVIPQHRRSTLGRRAFSVAGPMAWNALPDDLRDPSLSADNFRKTLKMHLFRKALGHLVH